MDAAKTVRGELPGGTIDVVIGVFEHPAKIGQQGVGVHAEREQTRADAVRARNLTGNTLDFGPPGHTAEQPRCIAELDGVEIAIEARIALATVDVRCGEHRRVDVGEFQLR